MALHHPERRVVAVRSPAAEGERQAVDGAEILADDAGATVVVTLWWRSPWSDHGGRCVRRCDLAGQQTGCRVGGGRSDWLLRASGPVRNAVVLSHATESGVGAMTASA